MDARYNHAMTSGLAAGLAIALAWQAQAAPVLPQSKNTAVIAGQIIDATTRQPVAGASVWLLPSNAEPSQTISDGSTLVPQIGGIAGQVRTDATGRFVFRDLPAGWFQIMAEASGYSQGFQGQARLNGPSQSLQVAAGQRVLDVRVFIWKFGAITGRVIDEAGEPVVGVAVTSFRRTVVSGSRVWQPQRNGITDDRGYTEFQVFDLASIRWACCPHRRRSRPPLPTRSLLATRRAQAMPIPFARVSPPRVARRPG